MSFSAAAQVIVDVRDRAWGADQATTTLRTLRRRVADDLSAAFNCIQHGIRKDIVSSVSRTVAVTFDGWTSSVTHHKYIALTVSYIASHGEALTLKSRCVACTKVDSGDAETTVEFVKHAWERLTNSSSPGQARKRRRTAAAPLWSGLKPG